MLIAGNPKRTILASTQGIKNLAATPAGRRARRSCLANPSNIAADAFFVAPVSRRLFSL